MTVAVLLFLTLLLALGLARLHDHALLRQRWDFTLSAAGSRAHEEMAAKLGTDAEVRAIGLERLALASDPARRRALMDVGLRLLERDSHDLATSLRGIAILSRMAAAIAPVRPLRPRAFRLGQLRSLAALGALAHHVVVTTGERLRLRAYVLRAGCGIVARAARAAVRRQHQEQLTVAGADLTAIGLETLETFHALLLSMEAEPRGGPVWVVDDWR